MQTCLYALFRKKQISELLTVSNISLASAVSDPFGKTATNIMKEIMHSEVIDDGKILKLIHKKCKDKDKILDSLQGYHIESDQRFKMDKVMNQFESDKQLINWAGLSPANNESASKKNPFVFLKLVNT